MATLLSVDRVDYSIGTRQLLRQVSFSLEPGERVCLLGRNGEGKSTLLKILAGELQAEDGTLQLRDGSRCALVAQQPRFTHGTVFAAVAQGLGDLSELINAYHQASTALAAAAPSAEQLARLNALQQQLEARDGWLLEQQVEQVISRLELPPERPVAELSGGWQRRVALARALVARPQLLLLDEPTNHLDIDAIEWLENFLLGYDGALLFVTHDRSLLQRLATRILELDRGRLTSWPGDYANYLRRLEEREAAEAKHNAEFDKKLAQEEIWIRQGIQARRTRNEGRARALQKLRAERGRRVDKQGKVSFELGEAERSGKLVIEASGVNLSFATGAPVIKDFSLRLLRGDRIGLLGPNGAGKTTLLKVLLGELAPDSGRVRAGSKLEVGYFDQHRIRLDDTVSALDSVADGAETVTVNGRSLHVISYLQRFLFPPERARSKVAALSGGERNRLLLARLFTKPVNLLVLDEPTNDLDLETLEVLEELLLEFSGTLLLVSHDRSFIDNVVTSTLVFEGGGRVRAYPGGYSDWLRQRPPPAAPPPAAKPRPVAAAPAPLTVQAKRKLSYREQRELERLPARIERLEAELETLQLRTSQADFYQRDAADIKSTLAELERTETELAAAYARWEQLE